MFTNTKIMLKRCSWAAPVTWVNIFITNGRPLRYSIAFIFNLAKPFIWDVVWWPDEKRNNNRFIGGRNVPTRPKEKKENKSRNWTIKFYAPAPSILRVVVKIKPKIFFSKFSLVCCLVLRECKFFTWLLHYWRFCLPLEAEDFRPSFAYENIFGYW